MGIYNFTRNIDAISYLIDNPNTYKDVAQFHMLGQNNLQEPNNDEFDNKNRKNMRESTFINSSISMPSVNGVRVIGFKNLSSANNINSRFIPVKPFSIN